MERTVEYYFSFISLWSYIGSRTFQELVERRGLRVVYKPVNLLSVFASGGGKPVDERPIQRRIYRVIEMKRWRDLRGIPLTISPRYYPADPSLGHRMLLAAIAEGSEVGPFVQAALKAVWADELDVQDPETLRRLAEESGLDGARLLGRAQQEPELAETADGLTQEAIERQFFGAPVYVWQGEPFWGQDRLDLLDHAIATGRAPILPEPPPPSGGRSALR
ncbi:2-hydroxychromene-2-carboxylate isomerase [Arenibaculum pallidiluteum]|uniref:2-hydroxychromene-2-carboxylate isomerase n=1 Tax=Arenibaculum pallidiluteum TaxID=2812559 RepID=UPI001A970CB1|nr:2-hydroxychromene-2-carboxylate isomerase [Arenibaculum pallidiluteum]